MWIGLIGPLMLESSKGTVAIPAAKHRVMLAMLALRAGRVVSFEELAEAAWDEPAPHTARVTVRNYILRLRKLLDLDGYLIRTKDPGYLLDVSPGNVDALRFCELCETGCSLARSGEWGQAGRMLREALALWRGTPLADIPSQALHDRWSGYLEQVRLRALRYRIQGDLHLGQHEAVTGELRELTTAHPLDEELWALLLLALYRSGRQGDALTAYRRAREVLVAELGVEPGPALGRLHQQILAHDPALDVAAPIVETLGGPGGGTPTSADGSRASAAVPVPRQLPAAMPAFAGRAHELKLLDDLLADATQGGGTVMISAIGGTAGVGKTTLALHFAHRVAERFPDGQLYVDLHGFHPSGEPASAGQAIGGFLDALGAPSDQMPADLDARAALYRSLLAGKQMLIVLDNAWDAAQVRPLLPGTPGCLVLVTSRNRLASLAVSDGARLLSLDLLTEPEARDLLAARLGAEAIAGQPQATADLITLCARLPLALAVAASRAVVRPAVPLSSLVAQVRSERDLLAALDAGEEAASVRAVFAWSHQQLTEPTARMFRLLGIHPGPDITTAAAASLAGVSPPQAREALRELTATGLLTEHVPGRYQFHDLLRHYAAELASTADSEENRHRTVCRMLDHYLHTANGLAGRGWRVLPLAAPASGVTPEPVPRGNGMAWIEAEHQVLLRLIEHAAASGFDSHAWQLLWAIAHYHDHRGYWDDWVTVHETALAAAQRGGDQDGLARSRYILGQAYIRLARYDEASASLHQALEHYVKAGDRGLQALVHLTFCVSWDWQHDYAKALASARQALDLLQGSGDLDTQAIALNNIGYCRAHLGDYREALAWSEQALALYQELGHRSGEANAWDSVGYAHYHLGHYAQAVNCHQHALSLQESPYERSRISLALGDAHLAAGDRARAREAWQQALEILEGLHHPEAAAARARLGGTGPDRSPADSAMEIHW